MKPIYILNSAFEEIKKQKFIHIVLVIAILICTYLLNYVAVYANSLSKDMATVAGFRNKDIYIASARVDAYEESQAVETYEKLKETDKLKMDWSHNVSLKVKGVLNGYRAIFYTENLYKNASHVLQKGKQLYEYKGEHLPILLTPNHTFLDNYDIGSVLDLKIEIDNVYEDMKFEIVGILEEGAYYYQGSIFNYPETSEILTPVADEAIIMPDFQLSDGRLFSESFLENFLGYGLGMPVEFWYCEITAPEGSDEYKEVLREINEKCLITPFGEVVEGAVKRYFSLAADELLIAVAVMLLTAVGLGSANIYIGKKQMRSFAINFISGAKWTDCLLIDLIRNLAVILVPAVLGHFISIMILEKTLWRSYVISTMNIWIIIGYLLLIFAMSSLPYIIKLKNTEPIAFVRTLNKD